MAIRTPKAWMPYAILAAALFFTAVASTALWIIGNHGRASFGASETQTKAAIGGPFALTDQNGNRRTDADFRGRYMLIFFGFTNCPDVCPTTLSILSETLNKLGPKADNVVPIFISVDPEHDTPEALRSYLASFGPRFVGLTGTPDEIAKAAKAYRVYYQKVPLDGGGYTMNHSSVIYLMDRSGEFAGHYALEQGPDALAADLAKRL
jgi:protein SCO1/2